MFFQNYYVSFILWIVFSVSEILKNFLILMISRKDQFYIKKEVYYASYIVSGAVASISFFLGISYENFVFVTFIISIGALFMAINDSISNRLWTIITIFIFSMTLNSITNSTIDYLFDLPIEICDFISNFSIIVILFIFYIMKYYYHFLDTLLNNHGVQLIKIVLLISACIQCLSASALYKHNKSNILGSNISYICVILLCSLTWYILNLHKKVTELSAQQDMLLVAQKEYYLSLLKKEEETRRYRHDMNNHLMCLTALAEKDDIPSLKEYLNNLQEDTQNVNNAIYPTGNTILTAITNHYISMVDKDTNVNISGKLTKKPEISNTDLCSIYANLIKNSIEELNRITSSQKKELNIHFNSGSKFDQIVISNTMKDPSSFRGFASKTVKDDKKNHGFGMQNINRIIAKNNGVYNVKKENDLFYSEIIIPVKIN